MPDSTNDAADRLERIYSRYRRSRRRRRSWAADNPGNVAIRAELFEHIRREVVDRLRGGHLLDVGCGRGWLLAELARIGVPQNRLHGVELMDSRVAGARREVPGADIRRADARGLPYESDTFDVVTMLTVLSSMEDRSAIRLALTEARRVLTAGGILLVYEPRMPSPFNTAVRRVTRADLDEALGQDWQQIPLTLLPPLARSLGPLSAGLYTRLATIRPLLSHRLVIHLEDPAEPSSGAL